MTPRSRIAAMGRGRWRIVAGIIAPIETLATLGFYLLVYSLELQTWAYQAPRAAIYAVAATAFILTSIAALRPVGRPVGVVSKVAIIAGWLAHVPALVYVMLPIDGVTLLTVPLAAMLTASVLGTAPLLRPPVVRARTA